MKTFKTSLLTIVVLLCSTTVNAHDFEVDGIYYNITSETNLTVSVTYKGSDNSSAVYSGNITIPSSVEYNNITYSVTVIGRFAFYGCTGLTDLTIPNGVKCIQDDAFNGCKDLTNITIPESVTSIGSAAFAYCTGLTSITIPNSVTKIEYRAFERCCNLTSITIPESVTYMGGNIFDGCDNLIEFKFLSLYNEKGLLDIIGNCTSVKTLIIGKNVDNVNVSDGQAHGINSHFGNLECIIIEEGNSVYDSRDNCNALIETETNELILGCGNTLIPNTVTSIKCSAFQYKKGLNSIIIPNSVTKIDIGAFYKSSLSEVFIPSSVEFLPPVLFGGCSALKSITCESVIPPTLYDPSTDGMTQDLNVFYGVPKEECVLYVPEEAIDDYKAANIWREFVNIVSLTNEKVTSITLSEVVATLTEGDELTLTATVAPDYATDPSVVWSSNNPDVVAVDENGLIKAIAPGAATITVTANDGSGVSASCEVTVKGRMTSIIITDPYTEDNFIQDEDEENICITYTRTLNNTEWNALYVPFEIPVSQLIDDYEVAYINGIHSYDDDEDGEIDRMSMEVVKVRSGTLLANHPYLIKARTEAAKQMNITVNNTTLYAAESTTLDCSSVYTKYEITGIYEKMTGSELAGCYALSGGTWKTIASNSYLNPFRLYLRITSRGNSPIKVSPLAMTRINIHVKGEESSTSVEEMMMQEQLPNDEIIYDLMGRRVENPVKGHIYIVNGMKRVY